MVRGAPAVTGSGRDPFAHYRAELDALGFKPSSARGQNFLLDPSLHRAIADAAAPTPGDVVLEVGAGLGFLTRELAPRCRRVLGVEIDDRLFALAQRELRAFANVQLLLADALGGPGRTLHPAVAAALASAIGDRGAGDGDYQVIANLPYSISGPLLAELACLERLPQRAVVLVQKELAGRIAAAAGGAEYGSLSVLVQAAFTARVLRTVPPEVFRPRPKVVSALLLLARRPELPLVAAERRPFARFVRALFQQRRKTLRLALPRAAAAAGPTWVLRQDLPPALLQRRAEALPVGELIDLWRGSGGVPPGPPPAQGAPE
jgi:16S rRNA (adenine1518-N6/adenine1519-N6)-dimethyltransferase